MNKRILEFAKQAGITTNLDTDYYEKDMNRWVDYFSEKFAELIVKEMCGMMEQAEDDAYHCFEPSERPTEYIEWLQDWQERFEKHFGVK